MVSRNTNLEIHLIDPVITIMALCCDQKAIQNESVKNVCGHICARGPVWPCRRNLPNQARSGNDDPFYSMAPVFLKMKRSTADYFSKLNEEREAAEVRLSQY